MPVRRFRRGNTQHRPQWPDHRHMGWGDQALAVVSLECFLIAEPDGLCEIHHPLLSACGVWTTGGVGAAGGFLARLYTLDQAAITKRCGGPQCVVPVCVVVCVAAGTT